MYYAYIIVGENLRYFVEPDVAVFNTEQERDEWISEEPEERTAISKADVVELLGDDFSLYDEDGFVWAEKKGTKHIDGMVFVPA